MQISFIHAIRWSFVLFASYLVELIFSFDANMIFSLILIWEIYRALSEPVMHIWSAQIKAQLFSSSNFIFRILLRISFRFINFSFPLLWIIFIFLVYYFYGFWWNKKLEICIRINGWGISCMIGLAFIRWFLWDSFSLLRSLPFSLNLNYKLWLLWIHIWYIINANYVYWFRGWHPFHSGYGIRMPFFFISWVAFPIENSILFSVFLFDYEMLSQMGTFGREIHFGILRENIFNPISKLYLSIVNFLIKKVFLFPFSGKIFICFWHGIGILIHFNLGLCK